MSKLMLINTVEGHECRIALLKDQRLEELYTERASSASQVGSIYKGRVTNIEPSIQAAFIDFGGVKNGFLHISDVHPRFFPKGKKNTEQVGRRTAHRTRPPIQDCLRRGQDIVVQMTKQGIGTKGPTLTTYLSIPGRLIVMMPDMTHVGISRKIEDEEVRGKLRKILDQLEVPKDMGVIVRTAGIDRSKRDLQRDMSYLSRLWKAVQDRINSTKTPAEIYQESDLVIRTIRDVFDSDVNRIVCDREDVAHRVKEFLDVAVPRAKCIIEFYTGQRGLFEEFGVEEEIRKVHSRHVELKNGGGLVFDQAEALVAIDVNSGSFRAHTHAETNALNLNLAAAEEIARQLRLRDMGGVIIIDFVDMRDEKNRRQLERKMRDLLKLDRAKSKVLRVSNFGIMEMTRQRLKPSLKQSIFSRCFHCDGTGLVMSQESSALAVMRNLQVACAIETVTNVKITVAPNVAHHLQNAQRQVLSELEQRTGKAIIIHVDNDVSENDMQIRCTDARGANVAWETHAPKGQKRESGEFVDIRTRPTPPASAPSKETADTKLLDEDERSEEDDSALSTEKKSRRRGKRGGRRRRKKTTDAGETGEDQALDLPAIPKEKVEGDIPLEQRVEETLPDVETPLEPTQDVSPDYAPLFWRGEPSKKSATPPEASAAVKSADEEDEKSSETKPKSKRPARRRIKAVRKESKTKETNSTLEPPAKPQPPEKDTIPSDAEKKDTESVDEDKPAEKKKTRRRGKRGGRKHKKNTDVPQDAQETPGQDIQAT